MYVQWFQKYLTIVIINSHSIIIDNGTGFHVMVSTVMEEKSHNLFNLTLLSDPGSESSIHSAAPVHRDKMVVQASALFCIITMMHLNTFHFLKQRKIFCSNPIQSCYNLIDNPQFCHFFAQIRSVHILAMRKWHHPTGKV